jgi:hypothetical protein
MSKLIEQLNMLQLNELKACLPPPILSAQETITEESSIAYKYKFSVTLGVTGFCRNTEEVRFLRNSARRNVAEMVFGEFRENLYKIEQAAFDHDMQTVVKEVRALMDAMFEVTPK